MDDTLTALKADWLGDLRSAGKAPLTLRKYGQVADDFIRFAGDDPAMLTKATVRRWLTSRQGQKMSTQNTAFACLKVFTGWLIDEEILAENPMAGLKRPVLKPEPVEPFSTGDIEALLATCRTWHRNDRRDEAIIRMLASTGMRVSELTGITFDKLDRDQRVIAILGKGSKWRIVGYDGEAAIALRKYLRVRHQYIGSETEFVFIGQRGRLGTQGVSMLLARRAGLAGVTGCHPHRFRRTFADRWLRDGGSEMALMTLAGWNSPVMLRRYTAAQAEDRAIQAYRKVRG